MQRVNFLYVDIRVYPASVEEGRHTGYDWDSLLIADQPVLTTYENMGIGEEGGATDLHRAIADWLAKEIFNKGKELIFQNRPKAPKK